MSNPELQITSAETFLRRLSIVEDLRLEGYSREDAKRIAKNMVNRPQNEPLSIPREGKHTKVKI